MDIARFETQRVEHGGVDQLDGRTGLALDLGQGQFGAGLALDRARVGLLAHGIGHRVVRRLMQLELRQDRAGIGHEHLGDAMRRQPVPQCGQQGLADDRLQDAIGRPGDKRQARRHLRIFHRLEIGLLVTQLFFAQQRIAQQARRLAKHGVSRHAGAFDQPVEPERRLHGAGCGDVLYGKAHGILLVK